VGIDIINEHLLPLKDYPKYLPERNGKRVSRQAGYRHALKGIEGVKLETVQFPGGRYTSQEAIQRFVGRLTALSQGSEAPLPAPDRKARRQSAVEQEIDQVRAQIRKKAGG
jgi:hypothetical protein